MQYQIEDIMRDRHYRAFHLISFLLDACSDELVTLAEEAGADETIIDRMRARIDAIFGPRESTPETISLHRFVADLVETLRPRFSHRKCRLELKSEPVSEIAIPPDVLTKVVEGLIRNAVENTPDNGGIQVSVTESTDGPELVVADTGVGITPENQALIFENYFTTYETLQYSSGRPYDFNAGGKGFDLLRMKIFSERYHFSIRIDSERCPFLSDADKCCPGDLSRCDHCRQPADCLGTGGTTVRVTFPPAGAVAPEPDERS
jgi:signal transduction histidine kinase